MAHDRSLDLLSFFLADVRGGLGPYVTVFLVTEAHWDPASIGAILTISGLIGISLHTPIGALIDAVRWKRGLIVLGVVLLATCSVAIERSPTLPVLLAADITMAVLGAVFAPTLAAITLGLTPYHRVTYRLARNAVFDRVGNVLIAGIVGLVGWLIAQRALFYLAPIFAVFTIVAAFSIPARAIDHERARGGLVHEPGEAAPPHPVGWRALMTNRPFVILAIGLALFHFASGSMLPLLGQKLGLAHPGEETLLTSACIVTAQLSMAPMALLVELRGDRWGRRPLLLVAFAAVPLRGMLYTVSDYPAWLIGVQVLDGVASGLFETLLPIILADIMRGTGRYNISRGMLGTIQGIGGSISLGVSGFIAVEAGYNTAFMVLAAVGAIGFILMWSAMPETRRPASPD